MAYHGTIEVYAKAGATGGYTPIKGSFYTSLIIDIGQLAADDVVEKILKYVQESLKEYNSINTGSIQYEVDVNPNSIIHILSDSDYEGIKIAPYRIEKNRFRYVVRFGKLIFEEDSENVNNIHRTYNNRNRNHSRRTRRSRSRSRSRSTRRSRNSRK